MAVNVTYQFNYTCRRPFKAGSSPWSCKGKEDLLCTPERYCACCSDIYKELACQYKVYALSRFWDTCASPSDEIPKLEPIDRDDNDEPSFFSGVMHSPNYYHDPETGMPYCDEGKVSMVIHPCCVPMVMMVISKGYNCLQKVICGTRPEQAVMFKFARGGWPYAQIDAWSGSLNDAWDRLESYKRHYLNIAINKLDTCMNATNGAQNQCEQCKAQKEVQRLYIIGNTVQEPKRNRTHVLWIA
ncbi:uncharacterized protein LOC129581075 [Paramacrobiotus metropolitanus]|uniref:uncharacterized protein LOC129581075 n=1 Tax=Paramacrobiotus metropolitanus TaxID=2943436 RepID=UPI00244569FE|nr:uncharacterized protein LOC129581075 [Paramacrobiotus metropolitanus]